MIVPLTIIISPNLPTVPTSNLTSSFWPLFHLQCASSYSPWPASPPWRSRRQNAAPPDARTDLETADVRGAKEPRFASAATRVSMTLLPPYAGTLGPAAVQLIRTGVASAYVFCALCELNRTDGPTAGAYRDSAPEIRAVRIRYCAGMCFVPELLVMLQ